MCVDLKAVMYMQVQNVIKNFRNNEFDGYELDHKAIARAIIDHNDY